jgi:hypothetical protein
VPNPCLRIHLRYSRGDGMSLEIVSAVRAPAACRVPPSRCARGHSQGVIVGGDCCHSSHAPGHALPTDQDEVLHGPAKNERTMRLVSRCPSTRTSKGMQPRRRPSVGRKLWGKNPRLCEQARYVTDTLRWAATVPALMWNGGTLGRRAVGHYVALAVVEAERDGSASPSTRRFVSARVPYRCRLAESVLVDPCRERSVDGSTDQSPSALVEHPRCCVWG